MFRDGNHLTATGARLLGPGVFAGVLATDAVVAEEPQPARAITPDRATATAIAEGMARLIISMVVRRKPAASWNGGEACIVFAPAREGSFPGRDGRPGGRLLKRLLAAANLLLVSTH